jgi:type II restriction enzyme
MATEKQQLGDFGEKMVVKKCHCPKCKKEKTLKLLPKNFKCADVICDFCGYLGQVKSKNVNDIGIIPDQILGAAWAPQKERMSAGIYFPLFIVLVSNKKYAIYYLSADLQIPDMFVARKPLSSEAKRAGWQGFLYDIQKVPKGAIVRLV